MQRATLAEKEVNTLKEQLNSSSSISQLPKTASALAVAAAVAAQNGIIPPSLASPSSENGALSLNSKLLNNNQIDEVNENKMDVDEQQQSMLTDKAAQHHSDSNRSTPVSSEKDGMEATQRTTTTPTANSNSACAIDGHSRTLNEEIAAKDKEVSFCTGFTLYQFVLSSCWGNTFSLRFYQSVRLTVNEMTKLSKARIYTRDWGSRRLTFKSHNGSKS